MRDKRNGQDKGRRGPRVEKEQHRTKENSFHENASLSAVPYRTHVHPKGNNATQRKVHTLSPLAGVRVVPAHLRRGVGGAAAAAVAHAEPPGTAVKRGHGHVVRLLLLHRLVQVPCAAVVATVVLAVAGVPQRPVVLPAGVTSS